MLEFYARNELILTNTKFQHPIKHRTTWQAPETPNRLQNNGIPRRHPTRNQIDYIIVRKTDFRNVHDSRSYSGINTRSDHRLVLATVKEAIPTPHRRNVNTTTPDLDKLRDSNISDVYKETLLHKIKLTSIHDQNPQQQWDTIVKLSHETSLEVLGRVKHIKRSINPEIVKLSSEQKWLNTQINVSTNRLRCSVLRKERNKKLTRLHNLLKLGRNTKNHRRSKLH